MTVFHGVSVETLTDNPSITGGNVTIGLVGTAFKGSGLKLFVNLEEAKLFLGDEAGNATLIPALNTIFRYGAGRVVVSVIPTANPTTTAIPVKPYAFDSGNRIRLPHKYISTAVVSSIGEAPTVYVSPTDYTVNGDNGEILRVPAGTIPAGATVNVGYNVPNYAPTLTAVNAAIAALAEAEGTPGIGFKPNILVVPNYDSMPTAGGVKSSTQQIIDTANLLKARGLVDSPVASSTATVLTDRDALNGVMATNDIRVILCHPRVVAAGKEEPLSLNLAGIIAKTDKMIGYWRSPDNQPLIGVSGIASGQKMSTSFVGGADNQELNKRGIYTVCAVPGQGLFGWGLWNSSFPGNSEITQYIPIVALQDILESSLTLAALPFLGSERGESTVGAIKERLLFVLNSEESLLPGSEVLYIPASSTPTKLAYGIKVFPKLPIENISMTLTLTVPLTA